MNPLILYSPDGKRTRRVYQIDAPGWINAGWTTEPPSTKEQESVMLRADVNVQPEKVSELEPIQNLDRAKAQKIQPTQENRTSAAKAAIK